MRNKGFRHTLKRIKDGNQNIRICVTHYCNTRTTVTRAQDVPEQKWIGSGQLAD